MLYRNLGNCKFEDVTEKAGVRAGGFGAGAAWGDYDRDGIVDLFVARYVHLDINNLPEFGSKQNPARSMSAKVQCGPLGLPGETEYPLPQSRRRHVRGGDEESRSVQHSGAYGMQPIWFDYDNDGWPDLYVANDAGPNYLYHNNHDGTFEDVSLMSGTAVDGNGKPQGSMGVDAADFDHDGLLDLFVTNFTFQPDTLYWNRGAQGFEDISVECAVWPSRPILTSGGARDFSTWTTTVGRTLWSPTVMCYPQVDSITGAAPYREPVQLFRNNRDRTFEDITATFGARQAARRFMAGRGVRRRKQQRQD